MKPRPISQDIHPSRTNHCGKIAWITPNIGRGSGGLNTIFQNINILAEAGYECDIYVMDMSETDAEVRAKIEEYYIVPLAEVYSGITPRREDYDLCFCTGWQTIDAVGSFNCRKAYFIQDFEPWFFPMGGQYLSVENSYHLGRMPITIGRWLAQHIRNKSKTPVAFFDFCADLNVYHDDKLPRENAICCAFQPEKDRRCPYLLASALRIVKAQRPDLTIYLYGSNVPAEIDFDVTELGILSLKECNDLYNKCALGVSMSSTNPSRIPFEMMAAGLPVVDLYCENNLYDFPDKATLLADPNPNAVAFAILNLLDDDARREKMGNYGAQFMKTRPLEKGYAQFLSAIDCIFAGKKFTMTKIKPSYKNPAFTDPLVKKKVPLVKRTARRILDLIHPRNFKKAYRILREGGVKEFMKRLKKRLHCREPR